MRIYIFSYIINFNVATLSTNDIAFVCNVILKFSMIIHVQMLYKSLVKYSYTL